MNVEPEVIDFDSIGSLVDHGSSDAALRVVLEITERALVARPAELLAAVRQVRELGWAVALDDVGAESASLAFMPLVRPDVVKLDLGLVQGVRPLARPRSCTRSTRTPKRTGAWVLGEGIETTAHLTAAGRWVRPWCRDGCSDARQGPPSRPGPAGSACGRRAVRRPAPSRRRSTSCRRRAVCALAEGLTDTPLPGVRGTHLADDDPLRDEWDVTVLSPHFAAALLARDLGEDGPEMERMFEYALTYDRDTVVAATRCLISRVTGLRPRH